jgi:hypothetical protein
MARTAGSSRQQCHGHLLNSLFENEPCGNSKRHSQDAIGSIQLVSDRWNFVIRFEAVAVKTLSMEWILE